MARIIISYVLPLVLPTVMYFLWTAWVRKNIAANRAKMAASAAANDDAGDISPDEIEAYEIRTPWFRLILAGAVLVFVSLVLSVFLTPKNPPESVYQPPRVEDGKVVPGQYVPKPN